ncbi:MAG: DUF1566 domain-containing protein [Deltaproteobacteria bacterium]|nr:MAG: DUF1566 domain-containing protein [Deltaproteobacteria bacterium]
MLRLRASCLGLCIVFLLVIVSLASAEERFTDNGDGTVTDHQLGVMWAKYDNQGDIDWRGAERYCRWGPPQIMGKYDNWRLPTNEELKSLFVRDKKYKGYESACGQKVKVVPEIQLSCGWVWTSEVKSITARVYNFQRGYHYMELKRHWKAYRALPVRDLQEGK